MEFSLKVGKRLTPEEWEQDQYPKGGCRLLNNVTFAPCGASRSSAVVSISLMLVGQLGRPLRRLLALKC